MKKETLLRALTLVRAKIANADLNARVEGGQLVPGARYRERQTPYVLKRTGG